MKRDVEILRELAKKYAEFALSDHCLKMPERYKKHNNLEIVRPPVLIFEVPWGELGGHTEMRTHCEDEWYRGMEWFFLVALFQKKHFPCDNVVHPYFRSPVALNSTGNGLNIEEDRIRAGTGSDIASHSYKDVLPDEEALSKLSMPEITLDADETQKRLELYGEIFDGIMPIKKAGVSVNFPVWDYISEYRGVENCMIDLYDRPEFVHKTVDLFTRIIEHELDMYEKLNVLETDPYYIHCTPACTYDLPVKDMDSETIKAKDVWCRAMAQPLSMVSPEMLDEFNLKYIRRAFDRCGLSYYGCCEPLDNKIDKLRCYKNLRRISISAWADTDNAADQMRGDYVLSYKPNPAFVASGRLDREVVEKDIRKTMEACRRNNTPCEFVLKDISTVNQNANVLTQWSDTVNGIIDEYFK